jgi:hypothetical protein
LSSYIVVAENDQILFAIQTPNEGILPDKINPTDQIVELPDESFSYNLTQMYYDNGTINPAILHQLNLTTAGPYSAGTITLQFQEQDMQANSITDVVTFAVTVNGTPEQIASANGILAISFNAQAGNVSLEITADRYQPVNTTITVGD